MAFSVVCPLVCASVCWFVRPSVSHPFADKLLIGWSSNLIDEHDELMELPRPWLTLCHALQPSDSHFLASGRLNSFIAFAGKPLIGLSSNLVDERQGWGQFLFFNSIPIPIPLRSIPIPIPLGWKIANPIPIPIPFYQFQFQFLFITSFSIPF